MDAWGQALAFLGLLLAQHQSRTAGRRSLSNWQRKKEGTRELKTNQEAADEVQRLSWRATLGHHAAANTGHVPRSRAGNPAALFAAQIHPHWAPHPLALHSRSLPESPQEQMTQIHHLVTLTRELLHGPSQRKFKDTTRHIQLAPLNPHPALGTSWDWWQHPTATEGPPQLQSVTSEHLMVTTSAARIHYVQAFTMLSEKNKYSCPRLPGLTPCPDKKFVRLIPLSTYLKCLCKIVWSQWQYNQGRKTIEYILVLWWYARDISYPELSKL